MLYNFFTALLVGIVVYVVSMAVPFLAPFAWLIALIAFLAVFTRGSGAW